jgi:hypothetical protein
MRPALYYIADASLPAGPSPREAEALRQARLAEVRALIAEIAAGPASRATVGSGYRPQARSASHEQACDCGLA